MKILMLGGSNFQVAAIKKAKEMGHTVILCDNTNCPGIEHADFYYPVSTTNVKNVIQVAEKERIDGILAYASDPAAYTAAYVAEKLDLPGIPPQVAAIMTDKIMFRRFQKAKSFNIPQVFDGFPTSRVQLIVKPADSSGSKGVTVCDREELKEAIERALKFSRSQQVIIEEYIQKKGPQIAGDAFVVDGKVEFCCLGDEWLKGVIPIGESFPTSHSKDIQLKVIDEIQQFVTEIGFTTGAINLDIMIGQNDEIYLMELGPRNGGNAIPEVIKLATGVDMIEASINAALGKPVNLVQTHNAPTASYILHSDHENAKGFNFSSENVVSKNIFTEQIPVFEHAGNAAGIVIMKFESQEEMLESMRGAKERFAAI